MYATRVICMAFFPFFVLKSVESAMTVEQMEKAAKGLRTSCAQKLNVDMALVEGIRRGEFPDDHSLACYTNCIMKKIRTFKNGEIDIDMVLKQVDAMMPLEIQDTVKAAARKCKSEAVGDDPCTLTYRYVKCNYETAPDVFFFP